MKDKICQPFVSKISIIIIVKMIPQKKKLSNDLHETFPQKKLLNHFLETFPECSLLIPVLKTTIKKISHRA